MLRALEYCRLVEDMVFDRSHVEHACSHQDILDEVAHLEVRDWRVQGQLPSLALVLQRYPGAISNITIVFNEHTDENSIIQPFAKSGPLLCSPY
jgi:hypothetical protein